MPRVLGRVAGPSAAPSRPNSRPSTDGLASLPADAATVREALRVRRERSFGFIARRVRLWLGLGADLGRFADAINERLEDLWQSRTERDRAIDELTELLNDQATDLNAERSAREALEARVAALEKPE